MIIHVVDVSQTMSDVLGVVALSPSPNPGGGGGSTIINFKGITGLLLSIFGILVIVTGFAVLAAIKAARFAYVLLVGAIVIVAAAIVALGQDPQRLATLGSGLLDLFFS